MRAERTVDCLTPSFRQSDTELWRAQKVTSLTETCRVATLLSLHVSRAIYEIMLSERPRLDIL